MNNLINTFLNQTYTTSDIKRRLLLLKNYIYSKFFGSSFTSSDYDAGDIKWLQGLGEQFFKDFTSTNSTLTLAKLEVELKKIRVLTVYVPFEMPDEEVRILGGWLRKNIDPGIIFETRIDPDLIGGTALSWKGIYKDYSLRQTLSEKRNEVLENFKGFIYG